MTENLISLAKEIKRNADAYRSMIHSVHPALGYVMRGIDKMSAIVKDIEKEIEMREANKPRRGRPPKRYLRREVRIDQY